MKLHPKRIFVLYPECTTTNGRGILQFNESLLTAPMGSRIFPVNLRYTPADITTPLPGQYLAFCWRLLSKPTHCIRVRIAESVSRASLLDVRPISDKDMATNSTENFSGSGKSDRGGSSDRELLIKIAEALARLGRTKRVGLSANDKVEFIDAWENQRSKVKK